MATTSEPKKPRDNFGDATKERLAAEVGYRCSLPDCGAPTIGPSTTEPKGISNSGVAAHITAAAPGGPRYDESLSPAERSSHENGIHCCAKHARIVDNDPNAYTVAQLRAWKAEAIDLQRRAHSTGDIDPNGRLKLARAARHELATRTIKVAIRCRAAIIAGVSVSDGMKTLRHATRLDAAEVKARIDNWMQEMNRATKEADEVSIDLRVHFDIQNGEPVGLTALIRLHSYLHEWRAKFKENMYRAVGTPLHSRPNFGPCDWTAVFNGDMAQREQLQTALSDELQSLERWAHPYIVTRE